MGKLQELKTQFNHLDLLKVFEVGVIDKRNDEECHILFDISIDEDTLRAEHTGLTQEEEESDLIAFKNIELDEDFSLDTHLQELYDKCTQAILDSEFYDLAEE